MDGWRHGGAAGGESRDTVRGAAGRERGGWDGRNTLGALVVGRAELDRDTVAAGKWMVGDTTVALLEGRVGTRCVVLLGEREVDGMDGNTLGALVVGRAELDRDTVNSAAGRERG